MRKILTGKEKQYTYKESKIISRDFSYIIKQDSETKLLKH